MELYTDTGFMVKCEALFALTHKASFNAISGRNASRRSPLAHLVSARLIATTDVPREFPLVAEPPVRPEALGGGFDDGILAVRNSEVVRPIDGAPVNLSR